MDALTYKAEEIDKLQPGHRFVLRPRVCGAPNCTKVHAPKWEYHNGRHERRYIGESLQAGRDQLPLWIEHLASQHPSGHIKPDAKVADLAAAIERAAGVIAFSRGYFLRPSLNSEI